MSKNIVTKIAHWYKKERMTLLFSASIGIAVTILFTFATASYSNNIQSSIAHEVIRFHVLANSDSDDDQALKLKVRDGVLEEFKSFLTMSSSYEQTKSELSNNLEKIIACAKEIIEDNGYDYDVCAKITKSVFPTKAYADVTFPAGEYEALRIEIGDAKGQNWWCVMFPPLCFVDVTQSKVDIEYKNDLKHILTEEEYDIVSSQAHPDDVNIQVKFKLVELWQSLKSKKLATVIDE